MNWWLLILSLPTDNATARMRAWRALKAAGAAVLRDGVYLMPARDDCRARLAAVADDVQASGGTALVVRAEEPAEGGFAALFDRSAAYAALLQEIAAAQAGLEAETAQATLKQARKLRRSLAAVVDTDFFPDAVQGQAEAALKALEQAAHQLRFPGEPVAMAGEVARRDPADYQGRRWATRRRPWVDRLACAWLIRRRIDPAAQLLWLDAPQDCPADAVGFDFDGATFSHVGPRVSFEVMLAAFGLETPALLRFGALVRFLDVGGRPPPEAGGIDSVLAGLRDTIADDDQLLAAAGAIFDGLLATFDKAIQPR